MIDLEQRVAVKWGYRYKKKYEDLGYKYTKVSDIFYPKLSEVSEGSNVIVKAVCDYCNQEYETYYYNYLRRKQLTNGLDCCKNCKGKKIHDFQNDNLKKRANNAFNKLEKVMNKNNYKLITHKSEYSDIYMEISYICPKHGNQTQSLNDIISNKKCPECSKESRMEKQRLSVEEVIRIIESVDNNKLLNPNDYIKNSERNLWIQCKCGNKYLTSLSSFKKGKTRCDECAKSESRGEKRIREYLENKNIRFIPQCCFEECRDIYPLPFDFYLPDYNKCLEYDGQQHEKPHFGKLNFEKTIIHDQIKNEYCKTNNIPLLRINYKDYKNIEKILDKELNIIM